VWIDVGPFGQLQLVLKSEDDAEESIVMLGAKQFAAAARVRAGTPGGVVCCDRDDGDAGERQATGE
jgi:hypothetical protein